MKYYLYHDESKIEGYWHGMLLVPENTKHIFFEYLQQIRENTGYQEPIGIKNIKEQSKAFYCAELWVLFAVGAMMSKFGKEKYPIKLGRQEKGQLVWDGNYEDIVTFPIGAKFILFRDRDNFKNMSDFLDHGGKVETTFRMGLKGGIHFLGDAGHPIEITKMHFDGYEHYQRNIDHKRIIDRLNDLREYFVITGDEYSVDDRTSDPRKVGCQSYEDCQFLQLTDLLVGSFRVAYGYTTNDKGFHERVAEPIRYLIRKYNEGYARMQNSRWNGALCMSECFLEKGKWNFQSVSPKEVVNKQGNLFLGCLPALI